MTERGGVILRRWRVGFYVEREREAGRGRRVMSDYTEFQLKMGVLNLTQIPCHHVLANEIALNLKYRIGLKISSCFLGISSFWCSGVHQKYVKWVLVGYGV